MGKTIKKNSANTKKQDDFYIDEYDCSACKHYAGRKRGCKLNQCRCRN